jgi:hypothetical protein
MNKTNLIISNGNLFPEFEGKALSWSIGAYDTINEAKLGHPRMKTVIRAMREYRPDQLETERRLLVRGSFDRVFGNAAKAQLKILEETI